MLVRALGADLRGAPFTRDELRTLAVWTRGDDPPLLVIDPGHVPAGHRPIDTCRLLLCLLEDDGVRSYLKRNEIDPDRVRRCLKRACG